ncbi:PspA/IM30 family protein [uncultured Agrococcus sp.]|uniref:PspA/IM30 family protein n=1 Tax=uncultured Agrococcus sp. TaxID=382258 RepID=UPI0025F813DF|nr:PspA/IM30 family protein [uncultured Agrococcus sp.]
MAKQSIFGRISQLVRANVNALIDQAEDPEKMLDQLVRDYTNSIADAESAIAQTIGNLRMQEQDYREDIQAAEDWGRKALAASQRADQLRSENPGEAERFDNLAKVALGKQLAAENEARSAQPSIQSQNETVEKLKTGLDQMKQKLEQLKTKRSQLIARQKTAQAQLQVADAVKSIDIMDPTSEIGRFEDKIRREEAKVLGQQELASSSLDAQFESLEDVGEQLEIEARLQALKGGNQQSITEGDNVQ